MAKATVNWHRLRKRIHLFCFLVFLALPFFNLVRFDLPRQRFYFFGHELWISEFGIVFLTLMFLLFVLVALSVFYGRIYCGYLCPQMIFSEASHALEARLRRWTGKKLISWNPKRRALAAGALFHILVGAASIALAFVFIAYFVEPRDLFHRLLSFDIQTAGGISGAAVTLVTYLDFSLLRLRFCATVCPYGYLQGMLADGNTLLVQYRDAAHGCIECKKCVRVCPMGIDIRKSPFQIECVHCGECIDACDEIMAKLKKPGFVHYTWGEHGERLGELRERSWFYRMGIRDAKRVIVLAIVAIYAGGLFTAIAMRRDVLVRVSPDRSTLYRIGADGRVYNTFRYSIANRAHQAAAVTFSFRQLPGGMVSAASNPVSVPAGQSVQGEFQISTTRAHRADLVTHFTIVTTTAPSQTVDNFPMTFIAPTEAP
jgi:cytochrome c oxidase accessory protein FixG